ncbi:GNAT family N-acetyltransferase [Kitasatospora sp. NPDC017646]|uniref:GNAT family N-acetyltransferase n=1 Tax=Kitasatospora sp. NPDC017646 TaxID=3364024 RepID=UPI0037B7E7B8
MTDGPAGAPATGPRITAMRAEHADAVLAIFQAGIDAGNATFETTAPTWEAFDAARLPGHRLVALDADTLDADSPDTGAPGGDRVLGWAAVSRVSTRDAYAGVVEHSVYVAPAAQGRGVGRALLDALLASTDAAGIWTVQSGIFPENTASLALHRRAGFRVVGTRERIGRLHGRWRDVVMVERRSPAVD